MKFNILESLLTVYKGKKPYGSMGTYMIYKNPRVADLNNDDETKENRTIIDENGNMFVEAQWYEGGAKDEYSGMLHAELLNILHKNGECLKLRDANMSGIHKASQLKNGLFMIRNYDGKSFYLASYNDDVFNDPENRKIIGGIFKKCKEKNPYFSFMFEGRN